MFEQSILLGGDTGKRTGALFASISAQIALVGVLLLLPLIYTETLPIARIPFTSPMPVSQPEQPAEAVKPSAHTVPPNIFHVPFRIPARLSTTASSETEIQIDSAAPQVSASFSVPLAELGQKLTRIDRQAEAPGASPAQPKATTAEPLLAQPIRVPSEIQAAKILKKVVPEYPPLARQARISGTVKLMGIIAKDGTVQKLQVLSGHPLLQKAALDAVSRWRYAPTILNGQPVEVIAPIDVIFTLTQ